MSGEPDDPEPGPGLPRATARRQVLVSLGSLGAGGLLYALAAPPMDVLGVQFGGASQPVPLPEATRQAVLWDFGFIAGYSLSLWTAAGLARTTFRSPAARAAAPLALVAASADVVENLLLLRVVRIADDPASARPLLDLVTVAATLKFACLVPAAAIGYTAVARTTRQLWLSRRAATADAAPDASAGNRRPSGFAGLPASGAPCGQGRIRRQG